MRSAKSSAPDGFSRAVAALVVGLLVLGAPLRAAETAKVEKLFKAWQPGSVPAKDIRPVALKAKPVVYIML